MPAFNLCTSVGSAGALHEVECRDPDGRLHDNWI